MNFFKTATEAWDDLFNQLRMQAEMGVRIPSRNGDVVGEILNFSFVIGDPTRGIVLSDTRKMDMRYAVGELIWYLSKSNQLSDIEQYSKFWQRISDDGITLNSAYGYRIHEMFGFDQWEYVKALLKDDPHSRQAVIHIKTPSNAVSKDIPCTIALQFSIRDNSLFLMAVMRSNDIWLGLPFDLFAFTSLQIKMAMELGVGVGDYTHVAGSLHLYEKDVKKWEKTDTPSTK